jgi:hypothetical protein
MPKTKGKVLATSSSLEGIQALISKYFYGSTITLTPVCENLWNVFTGKGQVENCTVSYARNRYHFNSLL